VERETENSRSLVECSWVAVPCPVERVTGYQ
jgi:hypothetical protein